MGTNGNRLVRHHDTRKNGTLTRSTCARSGLLLALALAAGCGGADSEGMVDNAPEFDRCALLTDTEVKQAIGPHDGGKSGLQNPWGLAGCRWTSTRKREAGGFYDGFDAIEVAVFDDDVSESYARGAARGEPVPGFVPGALYRDNAGELWFDCARDRFCAVSVWTADSDGRAPAARRFGELVLSRLH